eukprot:scaffold11_cov257-Pinguiococcus_pyrenoidosus.AAC.28
MERRHFALWCAVDVGAVVQEQVDYFDVPVAGRHDERSGLVLSDDFQGGSSANQQLCDFVPARTAGPVERRLPALASRVDDRAMIQDARHAVQTTGLDGNVQGRVSVDVSRLNIGAATQEEAHSRALAPQRSGVQWGHPFRVNTFDLRAFFEEGTCEENAVVGSGKVKGAPAILVASVDVVCRQKSLRKHDRVVEGRR